jgi:hypothetical protein
VTDEEIEFNRLIAVDALEMNPAGYQQIRSRMTDGGNGRCATGLIAEALHIPVSENEFSNDAYAELERQLGLPLQIGSSTIFHPNDLGQSFRQIASHLRKTWKI